MVSWWWVGWWQNSMVVRWLVTPQLTLIDTSVDTWLSVSQELTNFWLMHVTQLSAWTSVDVSSRMLVECWSRCLSILVNRSIDTCSWMPLLHMVQISLVLYHYAMSNWYHFVTIRSKSKTISWVTCTHLPIIHTCHQISWIFPVGWGISCIVDVLSTLSPLLGVWGLWLRNAWNVFGYLLIVLRNLWTSSDG